MIHPEIKVGVIGYGYWGPNMVRTFAAHERSVVTVVADRDPKKLDDLNKLYPAIEPTQEAEQLVKSEDVDAVVIATPVSSHYELAKEALLAGKDVLVEKPMTRTSRQAEELIEIAEAHDRVLMVDHTFVYTGAVRKMRELVRSGELGELYYFDSERINLGLLQQDVNVLWDLAVHDLSILLYLFSERPIAVKAQGYAHVGALEEMAELELQYESGFHAHIRVSWLSPVKMRLTMIGGSRRMVVYDDVQPSEKVRVYDKGIVLDLDDEQVTTSEPIYRAGDVHIPKLDRSEALKVEGEEFIRCIQCREQPLTCGRNGLAVVRILEAAERSLEKNGELIPLEDLCGPT